MSETYGLIFAEPFAFFDPESQCLRMWQDTCPRDSPLFSAIVPKTGYMSGGVLSLLQGSVPHTAEKESSLLSNRKLLPTPRGSESGSSSSSEGYRPTLVQAVRNSWEDYTEAVRLWESLTRPAPARTEPNREGNPRLTSDFSEWMMGLPAGYVSGLAYQARMKLLGNGVVPQQAECALRFLLDVDSERMEPNV